MNKALCAALASFMTMAIDAAQGQSYSVLHGFAGEGTGPNTAGSANPSGPLTYLNGTLYGVTVYGGPYDPSSAPGWGTIYSINAANGAGNLIYSFKGGQNLCGQVDGVWPNTGLLPGSGAGGTVLYGTTAYGGASNNGSNDQGTIFTISSTGQECVVWAFGGPNLQSFPDGTRPQGGLVYDADNNLYYGTTELGGEYSCGTIYAYNPSSAPPTPAEHVVYSFRNNGDGCGPQASLILVNGILYGTTSGYTSVNPPAQPLGSVFGFNPVTLSMVNSSGTAMTSDFQGGIHDGAQPMAPLVYDQAHNMLYGTTEFGGTGWEANASKDGYGTIFEVDLSASTFQETPIYFFSGGPDGLNPLSGLVYDGVSKYYTTSSLGPTTVLPNGQKEVGGGVLVGGTLSPVSGVVLHTFSGQNGDGYGPTGSMIFENGVLYGTTYNGGGASDCMNGCGTVFKYVP
jgi:uncharacterized repeat protein (TIGR03803 family)